MADVRRLLSTRVKDGVAHRRQRSRDKSSGDRKSRAGILDFFKHEPPKQDDKILSEERSSVEKEKADKLEELKALLLQRDEEFSTSDASMTWALDSRYSSWNPKKALELLVLLHESVEGVIKPYDASVPMLGAENRKDVSCYLDSVLFAMFAKLDSFEPMLYANFEDPNKRNLAALLRFWVNLLRTGKLIEVQFTNQLVEACAACDWPPDIADRDEQQDASDFFVFITNALDLPLLELKETIVYDHAGQAASKDDNKITNERMLDVAVPDEVPGAPPVKLEHCLELYFNNEIFVKRALERLDTKFPYRQGPSQSQGKDPEIEVIHVEERELTESNPGTPLSPYPPEEKKDPITRLTGRHRTLSLLETRITVAETQEGSPATPTDKAKVQESKEVMVPAYQFFNLMPWLAVGKPVTTQQEMYSYVRKRPVVCIHLKRYGMLNGKLVRKNTLLDIPTELRLPHFVGEKENPEGPLLGSFKLVLQSVICHRGEDLNSGHYISFVQGTSSPSKRASSSSQPPPYPVKHWIKHDDFSNRRVEEVDIEVALKDEMPFLLFFQVWPLSGEGHLEIEDCDPPAYHQESGINVKISESSPLVSKPEESYFYDVGRGPTESSTEMEPRRSLNIPDESRATMMSHLPSSPERVAHLTSPDNSRRGSAVTDDSLMSPSGSIISSTPATPTEETAKQRFARAAQRIAGTRSRPTSSSGENRISATFSRLGLRSEKQLAKPELSKDHAFSTPTLNTSDGQWDHQATSASTLNFETDVVVVPPKKGATPGKEHHHHHHSRHGKDKDVKTGEFPPDRQCTVQ